MKTRRSATRRRARREGAALAGRVMGFLLKLLLFVGFLAGLGYSVVTFAGTSDHFRIKRIEIEGLSVLDEQTIRDRCGITDANSVIFLRPAQIGARVEEIPYVRECRVTCVFPDTVVIKIEEREAVATIEADGRLYAVDAEGRVLEQLAPGKPHPGPLITQLPGIESVEPGQTLSSPEYREALAVWRAFSSTEPAQTLRLSELAAVPNDFQMYFDNVPYRLRWGRGDYETQAKRLDILWKAKAGRLDCRQYIDLRFGQDVACK